MLGVKAYERGYVQSCRERLTADVAAFASHGAPALESRYFNNLLVVLDSMFIHRLRTVEGKNGNPLNELRVLRDSLLENGGVYRTDKGIKLLKEKSLLAYSDDDEINLDRSQFERLFVAVFSEIESKFMEQ